MKAFLVLSAFLFCSVVYLRFARGTRPWAFFAGWLALLGALLPPLDEWAEAWLSDHMIQHEILMLIAAPLLVLARPQVALFALARGRARRLMGRALRSARNHPFGVFALHGLALWGWHTPPLYNAALAHEPLHLLQHLSFFGSAWVFWDALAHRRANYGAAAFYVFATSVHSGLLGALLFVAPRPWYAAHAAAHDALADQQLAGLIMWVVGGAVLAVFALALMVAWLRDSETRALTHQQQIVFMAVVTVAVALAGCRDTYPVSAAATRGSVETGREKIRQYGCWTCHTIPGIAGANGTIGPPLDGLANRFYVGGHPNSPGQLAQFIRDPKSVREMSPMPNVGVSEKDAADIVAFLYTLH